MQEINISQKSEDKNIWTFDIAIIEDDTQSQHTVTIKKEDYQRILKDQTHSPEELIRASFLFLLERESKESIFSNFDLMDITKYFPEYEEKIKNYL